MMRQQFGLAFGHVGELFGQNLSYLAMIVLPFAAQQGAISRLLNEGVFEDVGRLGWQAPLIEQFSLYQLDQISPQEALLPFGHSLQKPIGKLAAQRCGQLGNLFAQGQPVQAGHQQILEGGRNG
jgi:hypothetical protein